MHILILIIALLILYSIFIERFYIVETKDKIIAPFKLQITLISDLHLGKWKSKKFLEKVVNIINKNTSDYVFIAGDLTYKITKNTNIYNTLKPLQNINKKVFVVLGNHDEEDISFSLQEKLKTCLEQMNIEIIENKKIILKNGIQLYGIGDNWAKKDDISHIQFKNTDLVLTHNPDTTLQYTENNTPFCTFAGHTHGGQIRIPFLYKLMIPCKAKFDKGIHYIHKSIVFVSSGLGEVILPMRLFNPPEINIIHFTKHS